jgi:predicted phage terminase large subunit-like protein
MMSEPQVLLNAALRNDFARFVERCFLALNPGTAFKENWHHHAIYHVLSEVRHGDLTRLIINIQPRSLKSLIVSIAYPAFVLGHDPRRRIYVISYGDDLSDKHSADFRAIVESDWYKRAFPHMRIKKSLVDGVTTSAGGYRKSTTVMGALTGLGGDLFILDDPQKAVDAQSEARRASINQWFSNTLISRLDDKKTGAIVIVMQRVHMNDLCGHVTEASDEWTTLSLPAIAESNEQIQIAQDRFHHRDAGEPLQPDREPIDVLEKLQKTMPPDIFAAQYQQCPVPEGGAMIKREWFRYYEPHELPERTYRSKVFLSVDTAAKDGAMNDWSVCTAWLFHAPIYYLIGHLRGRFEYPQLRELIIAEAMHHKPRIVLIEDAHTGIALAQELKKKLHIAVKPVPVERDKIGRMYVQQEKFFAGHVRFPRGAPFLPEFERELLAFPNGPHDDQVDSMSQALNHRLSGYTLDNV